MSQAKDADSSTETPQPPDRRHFLSVSSSFAMASGLVASYGTFAIMAGRFLYPADDSPTGWLFVSTINQMKPGDSVVFTAPSGATIVVARQGEGTTADDFIALSSVCPHLGCQVHWESVKNRFFCPCHNGAFDAQGQPTEGPPKDGGQPLKQFPLKVEGELLFIEAPLQRLGNQQQVASRDAAESDREKAAASTIRPQTEEA